MSVDRVSPGRPLAAPPEKPASRFDKPAKPGVALPTPPTIHAFDVTKFRLLPLAGAPQVSAKVDETLGKTGMLPFFLRKFEAMGAFGEKLANGLRVFTRVVGPIAYGVSAVWNLHLLTQAWRDPSIRAESKTVLAVGTAGTVIGSLTAIIAALPAKAASFIGMGAARQVLANKASGIAGGFASVGFAAINMIETLRRPDAKPGERFFAKLGFGVGLLGFAAGTTALVLSMGTALPWLLPIASQVATIAGLASVAAWIGQMALGKRAWVNERLAGTFLG